MNLLLRTLLIFVFGAISWLQAADLRVEEVGLLIHEKAVTGYQVELKKSPREVNSGILAHLESYSAEVFAYEGMLIFENIDYSPIATAHPITLYYLMEDCEGTFTRLILVGMYDHQTAINATEFPDLALRMLLDLGTLVTSMTKQEIDFSHIFKGKSLEEVLSRDRKTRGEETGDRVIAEISRRLGENMEGKSGTTPLPSHEDFRQGEANRDTITLLRKELAQTQQVLSQTEAALSQTREDISALAARLNDQESVLVEYRDTIRILKDGVYGYGQLLEEQQAFIDTLLESIAETPTASRKNYNSIKVDKPLPESRDSISELLDIQYTNQRLMDRQQSSIDSLKSEVLFLKKNLIPVKPAQVEDQRARHKLALDSLAVAVKDLKLAMKDLTSNVMNPVAETNSLNRQIRILKEKNSQAADSIGLQKRYIHSLKVDNEQLVAKLRASNRDYLTQRDYAESLAQKTREQEQQMLEAGQVVEKARQDVERARQLNEKHLKTQQSQIRVYLQVMARADSLKKMVGTYKQDYHQLAAVNDSLKQEIDLLNPYTESAKTRRRVYQEQVNNLAQLEKRLPIWENEIMAREKLLKQREKYLMEYQKTGDLTTLLDRIKELEEEITRLNEILK